MARDEALKKRLRVFAGFTVFYACSSADSRWDSNRGGPYFTFTWLIAAGFLYFGLLAATKLVEKPAWWINFKQNTVNTV